MKIVHCIQGLEATSGVSVFCAELAKAQVLLGHDVYIMYGSNLEYKVDSSVKLICGKDLGKIGFRPDIVHQHAIWGVFCRNNMAWAKKNKVDYVVSVHGCLMPRVFTHGWLKKTLFFKLAIKGLMDKAKFIHCTGDSEAEVVKNLGLKATVKVAPLGCYLPDIEVKAKDKGEGRMALFLGRLGEEKGLMYLLDAWKAINNKKWRLVIAGPDWLGYGEKVKRKVEVENISGVEFPGSADAALKDKLYREADVFVLPSPMENFSAVVLDALAYKLPVIATKGTPWSEIETHQCGWWIEPNSVVALESSLRIAMNMPQVELSEMGKRGRILAQEKYSWGNIANAILNAYWCNNVKNLV